MSRQLFSIALIGSIAGALGGEPEQPVVPEPALPLPDWSASAAADLLPISLPEIPDLDPAADRGEDFSSERAGTPGGAPGSGRRNPAMAEGFNVRPGVAPPQPAPASAPMRTQAGGFDPRTLDPINPTFPEPPPLEIPTDLAPLVEVPPLPENVQAVKPRVEWHRNPRKARRLAEAEGKYFLLAFVGQQWNMLSRVLNDQVFSSDEFGDFAADNLVVAYLDFPPDQSKAHPVFHRFKEVCGVKGLPAVAIFAPDGKLIQTLNGFSARRGAFRYLSDLKDRIENDRTRVEAVSRRENELIEQGFRTWRNNRGQTIQARLRMLKGERVFFVDPDGNRSAVPIKTLGFVDREIARRLDARQRNAALQ